MASIELKKNLTVLISGKFKVLHAGHMRLLKTGKDLGTKLIVCVDVAGATTEEIDLRISLVSEISYVDQVVPYSESISDIIAKIKPDIVLKGSEYAERFNEEEEAIKLIGGRLLFTSGSTHFSQSDLISFETAERRTMSKLPNDFLKRNSISASDLVETVKSFSKLRVGVIGDLIVDEYITCHPLGMSQEDPIVVVTPIDRRKFVGGAAIVAAHSASLGARTNLYSVGGDDETIDWLETELAKVGVRFSFQRDSTRPTTLKQRFKTGQQVLLKLSHLKQDAISPSREK